MSAASFVARLQSIDLLAANDINLGRPLRFYRTVSDATLLGNFSGSISSPPVSCRIASPVESRPGDVKYTSGGTPSINDIRTSHATE